MLKVLILSFELLINWVTSYKSLGGKKKCIQYPGHRPTIHIDNVNK